jgi:hypothetical protein
MMNTIKNLDHFSSPALRFNSDGQQKTLSIPIRNVNRHITQEYKSKSWSSGEKSFGSKKKYSISPEDEIVRTIGNHVKKFGIDFKPYDAMSNCKSAGVIPYTIHNDTLYFLLQQVRNPSVKKDLGWNDFGGKMITSDKNTADTAAREFSEETSCLFYVKEIKELNNLYSILKDNDNLMYSDDTIKILKQLIPSSQKYYSDKITEYVLPIHISSKETYISYFVKVKYIPETDLPRAEDIHVPYEIRYLRTCKWFSYEELTLLNEKDFHKRLQITRIQQRIRSYHNKGIFI